MITLRCDSCNVMYESDELDDSPCAECGSDRVFEFTLAQRQAQWFREEQKRLEAEEAWIAKQKREFVAVDHLTPAERAQRNRELDAAMEHIQAVYAPDKSVIELPAYSAEFLRRKQAGGAR